MQQHREIRKRPKPEAEIKLLALRDIAEKLSVTPAFLHLEIARGRLCAVRLGGRVLIRAAELERYVRDGEEAAAAAVAATR